MESIAQKVADKIKRPGGLGEHAVCNLCAEEFADGLAWTAHRPWKSLTRRDTCRWPRSLRKFEGLWSLRPSARQAVEIADNGPPWAITDDALDEPRSRGKSNAPKTEPHNHAGSDAANSVLSMGSA